MMQTCRAVGMILNKTKQNGPCKILILYQIGDILNKKRILGECLLISSLPGKALRTLIDIARLAKQFNMRSQSRAW